jgi:hypothetical protein
MHHNQRRQHRGERAAVSSPQRRHARAEDDDLEPANSSRNRRPSFA